jgi:hypothetical protein
MKRLIATAAFWGVSMLGVTGVAVAAVSQGNPTPNPTAFASKQAPIAAFTDTTGPWFANFCGFAATFNAKGSVAPAGTSIIRYAWSFGDGNSLVTTSPRAFQLYRPGSYDVRLTVTDSRGTSASTSRMVSGGDLSWPGRCR